MTYTHDDGRHILNVSMQCLASSLFGMGGVMLLWQSSWFSAYSSCRFEQMDPHNSSDPHSHAVGTSSRARLHGYASIYGVLGILLGFICRHRSRCAD